ncbi:unnamed protein product [Penicillium roqueforti FM164]|uniref:Genomic scaffold, ProqFM164S01 n=1 Tax=Penicillium roqueforti (strain FM164) TaxID=1365484 RepID=W6PRW1_PENRF|nr:unnamed protein product [Penicillium roqueforti FM164]
MSPKGGTDTLNCNTPELPFVSFDERTTVSVLSFLAFRQGDNSFGPACTSLIMPL